jgi:phosphate transport system protein
MRDKFNEQLDTLSVMLIEMGSLVETAIAVALEVMRRPDAETYEKTAFFEHDIEHKSKEIESLCLKLLLRQQPVAKDLRLISAALKITTDLKRIGVQAANIAELSGQLARMFCRPIPERIPLMGEATERMVTWCIDAFVKKDMTLAQQVIDHDDTVDGLFVAVKSDLIAMIRLGGDSGEPAINLIMIAKYLERIADHAVNIAQWLIFSMTGVK